MRHSRKRPSQSVALFAKKPLEVGDYVVKTCSELPATAEEFRDRPESEREVIENTTIAAYRATATDFMCTNAHNIYLGCLMPKNATEQIALFDNGCTDPGHPAAVHAELVQETV
ncbi:hypothetical protein PWT90_09964 [Aphanocladium album]|nr:hypothetical protein PWT90_09964 [Aphanocladium album]